MWNGKSKNYPKFSKSKLPYEFGNPGCVCSTSFKSVDQSFTRGHIKLAQHHGVSCHSVGTVAGPDRINTADPCARVHLQGFLCEGHSMFQGRFMRLVEPYLDIFLVKKSVPDLR